MIRRLIIFLLIFISIVLIYFGFSYLIRQNSLKNKKKNSLKTEEKVKVKDIEEIDKKSNDTNTNTNTDINNVNNSTLDDDYSASMEVIEVNDTSSKSYLYIVGLIIIGGTIIYIKKKA